MSSDAPVAAVDEHQHRRVAVRAPGRRPAFARFAGHRHVQLAGPCRARLRRLRSPIARRSSACSGTRARLLYMRSCQAPSVVVHLRPSSVCNILTHLVMTVQFLAVLLAAYSVYRIPSMPAQLVQLEAAPDLVDRVYRTPARCHQRRLARARAAHHAGRHRAAAGSVAPTGAAGAAPAEEGRLRAGRAGPRPAGGAARRRLDRARSTRCAARSMRWPRGWPRRNATPVARLPALIAGRAAAARRRRDAP